MDSISLYGWNPGYCCQWMIRLNISKIYRINSACNKHYLLYGSDIIWVLTIVLHNVLHMFLRLQVSYMALLSLAKNLLY